jgi:hypothetical protein
MIFVCKLPINKIKGYLCSILSLSGQSTSGSPDHGPDKDSIENKMPFILYILTSFSLITVVKPVCEASRMHICL